MGRIRFRVLEPAGRAVSDASETAPVRAERLPNTPRRVNIPRPVHTAIQEHSTNAVFHRNTVAGGRCSVPDPLGIRLVACVRRPKQHS